MSYSGAPAYPDADARLYPWMRVAGLRNMRAHAECLMGGGADSPYYEWFAATIQRVAPRLGSLGIAGAAELELETLAAR